MNINGMPKNILEQLVEAGIPVDKIESMSWGEAFDKWCQYEGLINYGPTLRNLIKELQAADRTPHVIVLVGEDSIAVESDDPQLNVDVLHHTDYKKYYKVIAEPGRKYYGIE